MKKGICIALLSLSLASCASWNRIGDLTTIGNRNVDDGKKYSLLTREVEAVSNNGADGLEQAVDKLTKQYEGEFLRNAKVYVKNNGKKVKIIGDVWGVQNTLVNVTSEANAKIILNVGDSVIFKNKGKLFNGKIIGINSNLVVVEYGKSKKLELKYDQITKTNK